MPPLRVRLPPSEGSNVQAATRRMSALVKYLPHADIVAGQITYRDKDKERITQQIRKGEVFVLRVTLFFITLHFHRPSFFLPYSLRTETMREGVIEQ